VRECIDSSNATTFSPPPSSSEELFLDPGEDGGSATVFHRPASRAVKDREQNPLLALLIILGFCFFGFVGIAWLGYRYFFR
jgi:hypothetical protein